MQCREFEERMNDVLDRRLAPECDELLVRHAGQCAPCRRLLDGQAVLFAGVELLETPPLSARFTSAVLVQSGAVPVASVQPKTRSGKKWFIVGGLVTTAALALIAVAIGLSGNPEPVIANKSRPASPAKDATAAVATPKAPLPVTEAGKVPETKKDGLAIVAPLPAPGKDYPQYRQAINSLAAQLPDAVEKIDEVQQSTPGMRPIRVSFSMAIGTLQRTIPNRKREQPPAVRPDSGFSPLIRYVVV